MGTCYEDASAEVNGTEIRAPRGQADHPLVSDALAPPQIQMLQLAAAAGDRLRTRSMKKPEWVIVRASDELIFVDHGSGVCELYVGLLMF